VKLETTGQLQIRVTGTLGNTAALNSRLWVKSRATGKWRECTVVELDNGKMKIHYISYHPKYDEWISNDDERVCLERPTKMLEKDDNVSVYDLETRAWVEAEVTQVDEAESKVEVRYVGSEKREWILIDSKRISAFHKDGDAQYDVTESQEQDQYAVHRGDGCQCILL